MAREKLLKQVEELGLENLAALITEETIDEKVDTKKEELTTVSLDSIFEGVQDLPDGFKEKAKIIFEAAVAEKAAELSKETLIKLEESIKVNQTSKDTTDSAEVDSYLSYVAEQWYKDNEVAVVSKHKVDLAENLISGILGLLNEFNIEVNESDVELVAKLEAELKEADRQIEALILDSKDSKDTANAYIAVAIIESATTGMSIVERDKFTQVLGEMDYISEEDFAKKVDVLKNVFISKKKVNESTLTDDPSLNESIIDVPSDTDNPKVLDKTMQSYIDHMKQDSIRNLSKKKK